MNTHIEKKRIKPNAERLSAQVIARITPEHRATWERLGGADWLRAMLDLLGKNAQQKTQGEACKV